MNRRGFVGGMGALAAAGAAAQALRGPGSGFVISDGFSANGNPVGITSLGPSAPGGGLTLGYIPGSAEFLQANTPPVEPKLSNLWRQAKVRAAIAILGYVPSASPTIERVDVTVNFACAEPPFYAPFSALFYAWQYVKVPGQYVQSASGARFTTNVPDAAAIAVNFQVKSPISGLSSSGALSYPIGGFGLGPGIYALAGPSPTTIGAPDWNQLTWGETAGSPIVRRDGMAVDFDYITLVLSPTRSG